MASTSSADAGKATTEELGELVAFIVSSIVDDPTQVHVGQVTGETTVIYELSVAPDDVGHVIGKGGRTASAIRTVLRAASGHYGKRAGVEIVT